MGGFGKDFEERFNWQNKGVEDTWNGKFVEAPKPLPAPPDQPNIEDTLAKAKKKTFIEQAKTQGRKSTFLTSARGEVSDVPDTGKTSLGG